MGNRGLPVAVERRRDGVMTVEQRVFDPFRLPPCETGDVPLGPASSGSVLV